MARPSLLRQLWSATVLYTLFVILFGAVVRITGSGAGCGQHWPTCHGEIAHLPQSIETAIEMTHRLTSGLAMLGVFVLTWLSFRRTPRGHGARAWALTSSVFMITEALVGAGLVLLELVGHNDSVPRAVVMAVHLLNTAALLFALVGVTWLVDKPAIARLNLCSGWSGTAWRSGFWSGPGFAVGALLLLAVSAAGAVTALGDTVYPVGDRSSYQVAQSLAAGQAHYLEQLRGIHPLLAVAAAGFFLAFGARLASRLGRAIVHTTLLQLALGVLNIYLSAPGWMQVIHLAVANLLWLLWTAAWFTQSASAELAVSDQATE